MLMSRIQHELVAEAKDMWSRGFPVPVDMAMQMKAEGLDVERLEAKYLDN